MDNGHRKGQRTLLVDFPIYHIIHIITIPLLRWKHAASCHRSSIIPGEGNVYFHDSVYHRLQQYERKTKPKDNERKTEDDSCV